MTKDFWQPGQQTSPFSFIGTPGRLTDLARQGVLPFNRFNTLILDEFDRLLDMGFSRDIQFIVNAMSHYEASLLRTADDIEDPETTYTISQLNELKGNTINVRKAENSKAQTPLSVGGSLVFNAETINQGGVIKAPQGEIILGASSSNDSDALTRLSFAATNLDGSALKVQVPVVQTKEVNLLSGSQTSVSLENLLIPYGMTADGQNLQYNGSASSEAGAAIDAFLHQRASKR